MESSGEWQCVRRGKRAARRGKADQSRNPTAAAPEPADRERDTRRITEAVNELRCEDFWLEWRDLLSGCLVGSGCSSSKENTVGEWQLECVCYGLGNFSSCVSARYQLAMLLLLFEALQIPVGQCSMYDPVFTVTECEILKELGFTVLTENEEGKRAVCHPTFFYLMHCGKALYNNLLWSNWSPQVLPNVIVIGNSFLGIQERMLQREFERDYNFLSHIVNVCEETSLPCSQRFMDVFNDSALIQFPADKLQKLPESIWTDLTEPQYQHCHDLEIIQRGSRHLQDDKCA
ncbi:SRR1-like protein [Astyanax mexicanus]|uniref:SRR1 domain containing n=1 Tax=Astyanax mexicanus TaxID=7994 RepID=A0A3B1JRC3_ASTMX|nr:SRR1-like protein [Astyanax mexicanus]